MTQLDPPASPLHLFATALRGGRRSKFLYRALISAVIIAASFTAYVIFGTDSPFGPDPETVVWLVLINVCLLLLLGALITYRLLRLLLERKKQAVGSRLQSRIIFMFSLVSVIPTIFMAVFSVIFFNQGIQSWFDDRVATALEESVAVAESYLEEHRLNIRADALAMANDINNQAIRLAANPAEFKKVISTQSAIRSLREALIFKDTKNILAKSDLTFSLTFEVEQLPADYFQKASKGNVVVFTNERGDRVRALIRLAHPALQDTYLLVGRFIDEKVLSHMELTQSSVDEYQRLRSGIGKVQLQFTFVFIAVALLILLASIWGGMIFAGELVNPLSRLIKATERVKGGDLNVRVPEGPLNDETATLGRAFNRMTDQLEKQRSELVEVNRLIDERRRLNEAVLSNVSAGVLALDKGRIITLSNRAATDLLHIEHEVVKGAPLESIFPEIAEFLDELTDSERDIYQRELRLRRKGQRLTFLVRIAKETTEGHIDGYVVTFDDITELVAAQRNAAWSDVARRIAHEIKNPLTPIQLSLDRLRSKYGKQIDEGKPNFDRYIDTINRHVRNIGDIIEEFSQFARMPQAKIKPANVSKIIRETAESQNLVDEAITIELDIPEEDVTFSCDAGQIGQVLVNLVKNAQESVQEALATQSGKEKGHIQLTLTETEELVVLHISDNGTGFPQDVIERATEPYVTTKSHGTGLGLAIVQKVIADHDGTLKIQNIENDQEDILGASITISLPKTIA